MHIGKQSAAAEKKKRKGWVFLVVCNMYGCIPTSRLFTARRGAALVAGGGDENEGAKRGREDGVESSRLTTQEEDDERKRVKKKEARTSAGPSLDCSFMFHLASCFISSLTRGFLLSLRRLHFTFWASLQLRKVIFIVGTHTGDKDTADDRHGSALSSYFFKGLPNRRLLSALLLCCLALRGSSC